MFPGIFANMFLKSKPDAACRLMHCPHFRLQLSTSSSRLAQRRTLLLTGILLALVVLLPQGLSMSRRFLISMYSMCQTSIPSVWQPCPQSPLHLSSFPAVSVSPGLPGRSCQTLFRLWLFADALIICEWLRQASWWNVWESCAYLKLWAKRLVCSRSLKPTQIEFYLLLLLAHTLYIIYSIYYIY